MYIPVSSSGIQLLLESETSVDHSLSPFLLLGPMQREEEIASVSVAQISNFMSMLYVLSPNSLLMSATLKFSHSRVKSRKWSELIFLLIIDMYVTGETVIV